MTWKLAALVGAVATMTVGPAMAACRVIDEDFDRAITADLEERAEFSPVILRDARQMRDAADLLQLYDEDSACRYVQNVVGSLLGNARSGFRRLRTEPRLRGYTGERRAKLTMGDADYSTAAVIGPGNPLLPIRSYLGLDVLDPENRPLGEAVDFVPRSDGQPGGGWLIVNHGSMMRLGSEESAVPVEALRIVPDGTFIFVPFQADAMLAAPKLRAGALDWMGDAAFIAANDRYYAEALAAARP